MAVMNITPDSFSDGGSLYRDRVDLDLVLAHAERCLSEGATILDVGGESTRPGAKSVSEAEELARVIPSPQRRKPAVRLSRLHTARVGANVPTC